MSIIIERIENVMDMSTKDLSSAQREPLALERRLMEDTSFQDFLNSNNVRIFSKGRIELNGECVGCYKSKEGRFTCHILGEAPVRIPNQHCDALMKFIVFKIVTARQMAKV